MSPRCALHRDPSQRGSVSLATPSPDHPDPQDRPRTAELLAPHLLREDVRLSASDRPGTFQLVAADPTGGVIRCLRADPPARGELVSFSPLGTPLGPVRLVGRTAGRVRLPGGAPGPFFATEWVAITALGSASYLIDLLRLLGVKIHAVDLPDALGPGQELVYEPAAQHVRLLTLGAGRARQPTVDFGEGPVALDATDATPGVLVETHRRRDSSWRKRLRLASSARLPAAAGRAGTAPGVGPTSPHGQATAQAGEARGGRRARRGPTAPAWGPLEPEARRRLATEPPVEVRAPRPGAAAGEAYRKRPTVQETQAFFPRDRRWFEKPADGERGTARPPASPESLHPMFRRREFGGTYRGAKTAREAMSPRAASPREVAPSARQEPGRHERSSPAAPPRRARTPAPSAHPLASEGGGGRTDAGGVPAWSSRAPEFPCAPREGQLEWGANARPVVCVTVGQLSLIFRVTGRVVFPDGAPVVVRLPLAPVAERGAALEGRVQRVEFDRETGATTVRVVLVPRSVPPDYRRFVQYWARKGR